MSLWVTRIVLFSAAFIWHSSQARIFLETKTISRKSIPYICRVSKVAGCPNNEEIEWIWAWLSGDVENRRNSGRSLQLPNSSLEPQQNAGKLGRQQITSVFFFFFFFFFYSSSIRCEQIFIDLDIRRVGENSRKHFLREFSVRLLDTKSMYSLLPLQVPFSATLRRLGPHPCDWRSKDAVQLLSMLL